MKFPLIALIVPFFIATSTADTQGSFQLYSDGDCTTLNGSSISAVAGSCQETKQASSIAAISFPSCPSGDPILFISDQTECNPPSVQPAVQSGNIGDCLSLLTGAGIGSAAFICRDAITTVDPQPAKSTGKSPAATTIPDSSSAPTNDQNSGQSPSFLGGMDLNDRISLGVGLGVGIPALVIAFLTWRDNILHHFQQQHPVQIVPPGQPPPPYTP